jgi:transcription elongation factor SPT5
VVGAFKLNDLVLLESASTSLAMPSVGVVIQLEKDLLQVLDNHNKVRPVRPVDAQPHKKSATAVALDSEQQTVGTNDIVRIVDGQYKGKTGTVRHIFRAFLFLYSPSMMTNSGTFVGARPARLLAPRSRCRCLLIARPCRERTHLSSTPLGPPRS